MENSQQSTASDTLGNDQTRQGFHTGIADAARREVTDLRDRTAGMAQSVRDEGTKVKTTALRMMVEEVDMRKAQLVDGLTSLTDVVRDASEKQEGPTPIMAQAVRMLEHATETLDGHSMQDFGTMLTTYSRRNPATFVAGCLLAGLALGRFVTATGSSDQVGETGQDRPDFGARSAQDNGSQFEKSPFENPQFDGPGYPAASAYQGGTDGAA